jgi:hypothetical protein
MMRAMVLLFGVGLSGLTLASLALAQAPPPPDTRPEALMSANERGNAEMLRARIKDVKILGTKKPATANAAAGLSPQSIELMRASQAERKRAGGGLPSSPFKVKGVSDNIQSRMEHSRKGIRANEVTVTEWMGLVRRAANSTARATAMRKVPGRSLGAPTTAVRGRGNLLGRKPIGAPTIGAKSIGELRGLPMSGGQPPSARPRFGPKPQ